MTIVRLPIIYECECWVINKQYTKKEVCQCDVRMLRLYV